MRRMRHLVSYVFFFYFFELTTGQQKLTVWRTIYSVAFRRMTYVSKIHTGKVWTKQRKLRRVCSSEQYGQVAGRSLFKLQKTLGHRNILPLPEKQGRLQWSHDSGLLWGTGFFIHHADRRTDPPEDDHRGQIAWWQYTLRPWYPAHGKMHEDGAKGQHLESQEYKKTRSPDTKETWLWTDGYCAELNWSLRISVKT